MDQYPIPQEISSYEFRLVGDMTLRQFLKLAAGLIATYLVYRSGLTFILRLPLSLILFLLGIGTAFLPFNEKPLDFWLMSFFKAVYAPTIFIWNKPFSPLPLFQVPVSQTPMGAVVSPDKVSKPLPEPEQPKPIGPTGFPGAKLRPAILPKQEPALVPEKVELSSEEIIQMIKKTGPKKPISSTSPEFLKMSLPATPTTPDIVSGLVMDSESKSLEGAIVEIQDLEGNPKRAMRTNSLGQFQTATPLPKGQYLILIEKTPYQFAIIKIEVQGKIISPLQIQAKKPVLA